MARYLEGLKLALRDRIGVQVIRTLSEAKNLAMRAELMQQDQGRRNFGGYRSTAWSKDKFKDVGEQLTRNYSAKNQSIEDKAAKKRQVNEG